MSVRNGDTELQKNLRRITELKAEIEDLESSRDGLLDWTDRQNQKCKEIAAKLLEHQEEFNSRNNILDQRNKELVQREQTLIRREIEFQKLLSEAQSERNNAEMVKKEVQIARQLQAQKEQFLKERGDDLLAREAKVDEKMSYIQSVFKTIEKLKV